MGLGEVDTLRKEFELRVNWQPFLLRPETPDEGLPLPAHIKQRMAQPNNPLKARAAKLGLTMVDRDIIPSTRKAHEAAEVAKRMGQGEAFHRAVLTRYWSGGEDISKLAVLERCAQDATLDVAEFTKRLASREAWPTVEAELEAARDAGVSAVPTFVIANKFVVQGAEEASTFREAFRRLAEK